MATSLTHGFLFADLRGYTAYVERRGAVAAAALLERYRTLVRSAVAAHNGAEIRTEGDSFYVVFPSASMAVACALDIVRAAADEAVHDDPILVGVGVHAGEAVETPDGPVGTSVNIAARLCAMAGPGEVLVSDTVRALTRSVGTAGFVSLGKRPIKGLDEALSLYRAVPAGIAIPSPVRRRATRARQAAGGFVGLALVAGLALVTLVLPSLQRGTPGSAANSPSSAVGAPTGASPKPSRIPVGQFRIDRFAAPFTISLGREWESLGSGADLVAFEHNTRPIGWIDVIIVAATLDPPCVGADPQFIGERPQDLIDWLTTRTWLDHGEPRPFNVDRYIGRSIDVTVPQNDRWTCPREPEPHTAQFFRLGGPEGGTDYGQLWGANERERKRFVALDVDGRTITFVIGTDQPGADDFIKLATPLIQTVRFDER